MPLKKYDFIKSIRELSDTDLTAKLKDEEIRLKKMKFTHAVSPLENPLQIRTVRKDIARIQTEIKNRESLKIN